MASERIMLVDDEVEFVAALSERLEMRGLIVDTASGGEEAIEKVRNRRFDAVILDLAMPGMDGIETLRTMRELSPDLQVILLSGRGTVKKSIEAMKLGAMDFLQKPVKMDVLLERIREARKKGSELEEQKAQDLIQDILQTKGW